MKAGVYKNMKTLAILLLALLCGCATLNDPTLTTVQRVERIADDDGALIRSAVSIVTSASVQFAEQNPDKRAELAADLERLAAVVASLAGGAIDPDSLVAQLKVKERYVQQILSAVAPIYRAAYERLRTATDNRAVIARIAGKYLVIIADGIRDAAKNLK